MNTQISPSGSQVRRGFLLSNVYSTPQISATAGRSPHFASDRPLLALAMWLFYEDKEKGYVVQTLSFLLPVCRHMNACAQQEMPSVYDKAPHATREDPTGCQDLNDRAGNMICVPGWPPRDASDLEHIDQFMVFWHSSSVGLWWVDLLVLFTTTAVVTQRTVHYCFDTHMPRYTYRATLFAWGLSFKVCTLLGHALTVLACSLGRRIDITKNIVFYKKMHERNERTAVETSHLKNSTVLPRRGESSSRRLMQ
nr:hypothetical protein CFP56_03815 [Quercus suber]